ncbi:MAG: di-trans,poly-cis-decaprenylcistransferase [Candidatus Altiarchaeales archaeon ex4484_96]|nr:MAG: di-trans,poly-cis-decaprenylcistransferase [Candidatus Altiarchaeales archaeon ex4484_96]
MHVGIIPDGNRRYMKKTGIVDLEQAYRLGIDCFYNTIEWCDDLGIDEVTIYTLSLENLKNRSTEELFILMNLFAENTLRVLKDERMHKRKVKVSICGNRDYLVEFFGEKGVNLNQKFNKLENKTHQYDGMKLNLAIAYGGRQEIINACQRIQNNGGEFSEEAIQEHLWIKSYPDIIIRTSESRLSNFLLWQSAYSELYFVDKLWEEFAREDLVKVLKDFKDRDKRYGR